MPGGAISVEPSGMPADRVASGDVVCIPADGCVEDVVWAMTGAGDIQPAPTASDTHRNTNAIRSDLSRRL